MGNTGEPLLIKDVRPKPPFDLTANPSEAQVVQKLQEVVGHLGSVARYEDSRAALLNSNFVIEGAQISSLGVDRLTGGLISTTDIEVGSDKFLISSTNRRLTIKDDNDTTRVDLGRFGAGVAYGLKMYDDAGNIIVDIDGLGTDVVGNLQIASGAVTGGEIAGLTITNSHIADTTLTGVKLQDATIGDVKIADLSATKITGQLIDAQILEVDWAKITNAAVESADIVNLSATKIVAGTLTVDGGGTGAAGIHITTSGGMIIDNGGDILFNASTAGDDNLIHFRTSGGSTRGWFGINTGNGEIFLVSSTYFINIDSSSAKVRLDGTFIELGIDMYAEGDNIYELGNPSTRWSDVNSVLINGSDIGFDNLWFMTELNNVFQGVRGDEGIAFFDNEDKIRMILAKDGLYADNIQPLANYPHINKARNKPLSIQKREKDTENMDYRKRDGKWERAFIMIDNVMCDPDTKKPLPKKQVEKHEARRNNVKEKRS